MTGEEGVVPPAFVRLSGAGSARLLPWSSSDGNPCYLVTDNGDGYLSRVADSIEASQLDMAARLLSHAEALVREPKASARELRYVAARLVESLHETLRVARSRGGRLPRPVEPFHSPDGGPVPGNGDCAGPPGAPRG
ncbi:hypothetical protein [Streptomyces uncialis]|uniref:hypothetical protein n=1 Tax=Streptomyces uncialis TaxID=1048205 RepID=UPI00386D5170